MIDKAISYSRLGLGQTVSSKEYVNKDANKDAGYKLNIGEVLKGHLMKNGDLTLLKTAEGQLIPAKVLENVDFGKLLQFIVVGEKDGKFLLEMQNIDRSDLMEAIDKIISELQLPNNDSVKEIIYKLLDQNLPLDKSTITKMYSAEKLYDIPIEVLLNLKNKDSQINLNEIKNLGELKKNILEPVTKNLLSIIDNTKDIEDLKIVTNNIANKLDVAKIKDSIISILEKEYISAANSNDKLKYEFKPAMINNIKELLNSEQFLKSISTSNDNISSNLLEKNYSKFDIDLIINKLSKNIGINNLGDNFIKSLSKELIKTYICLDMESLKTNVDEAKNTTNLHEKLESILKECTKLDNTKQEDMETFIAQNRNAAEISEVLTSIKKYNVDGQYFCFPMMIKDEQRTGELYFFKPKKNPKGQDEKLYIVLALDMPNLNKIEVHINQIKDNIELVLKVKSEDIKKYLTDKKDGLLELMNDTGFTISSIDVKLLDIDNRRKYDEINLYHLDIKA